MTTFHLHEKWLQPTLVLPSVIPDLSGNRCLEYKSEPELFLVPVAAVLESVELEYSSVVAELLVHYLATGNLFPQPYCLQPSLDLESLGFDVSVLVVAVAAVVVDESVAATAVVGDSVETRLGMQEELALVELPVFPLVLAK